MVIRYYLEGGGHQTSSVVPPNLDFISQGWRKDTKVGLLPRILFF